MKWLLPTFAYIGIILFAACSKEKPVPKVTGLGGPIRTPTPPGPTTGPTPLTPHIDTFIGDAADSVIQTIHASSFTVYPAITFTVQYMGDDTIIFRSLQELPAGSTNVVPFTVHAFFNDTFIYSSSQLTYQKNQTVYYFQGSDLHVDWTYDRYDYLLTYSCNYIGHKQ